MKKRLLSLGLVAILCFQLMPLWAVAAEDCAHIGGQATCTQQAQCESCGELYGELADHTDAWFYDRESHWMACTRPECGLEVEDTRQSHSWDEDGIVCTVCGYGGHTTSVDWVNDTLTVELTAALGDQLVAALYDEDGKFLTSTAYRATWDGSTQLTISGLGNAKALKVFSFSSGWQPNRPALVQDLWEDDVIQQESSFAVTDIRVEGTQLTAILQASRDCVLHLAAYDETSDELLQEQNVPVSAGDVQATLTMEGLPKYFKLRAQLRNQDGTGLHETFLCLYYTSAFENFSNQTEADFPADRVLSMGGGGSYAVLKEDVTRLDENGTTNRLVSRADGTAVFENADETLTSLEAGDKVAFLDTDGSWAAAVIQSMSVSGDQVTIAETSDSTVSDFYSSVKINAVAISGSGANAAAALSSAGMTDTTLDVTDVELGSAFNFTPSVGPLSLDTSIQGGSKVIFYYDETWFGKDSMMVGAVNRVKASIDITIGPNANLDDKIELGELPLTGIKGVADISMPLEIPFKVECAAGAFIPVQAELSAGYLYIAHNGEESTQKIQEKEVSNGEYSLGGKIELSCGVRVAVEAGLLDDKLALSFGAGAGLEAEGKLAGTIKPVRGVDEYHACYTCITGSTSAYLEADINLDYEITEKLSGTLADLDLLRLNWNIGKFYFSIINDERSVLKGQPKFGEGECPNKGYQVIISTWDDEEEVKGISIDLSQSGFDWTDEGESQWVAHLYPGTYSASATIRGNRAQAAITVNDVSQKVKLVGRDKTISGVVTNQETGEPISGASVMAVGPENASVSSDGTGAYEMKVCDGDYAVSCAAKGFTGRSVDLSVSADTVQNFSLRPIMNPGILSGVVTDQETGEPIQNAAVTIAPSEDKEYRQTIHTDSAGAYSVELSEGLYDVSFSAEHYKPVDTYAGVDPENTTVLNQELERYRGSLAGTITATETEEVTFTGATISVTVDGTEIGSASTGADGAYRIDDLPSGGVQVMVRAEGYGSKSGEVSIPDEDEAIFNAHLTPSLGAGGLGSASWEVTDDGTLRIYGTGSAGGYNWNTYWGRPSTPWVSAGLADKIQRLVVEEGITSFGRYTFAQLRNLTSVELPDTLTAIGESSFKYCDSLSYVSIPGSVTSIFYDAFDGLDNLKTVVFEEGATTVGGLQGSAVETVVIPDTVESFGNYAFNGCTNLKTIHFPKNLKTIGAYAFNYSGITSAVLPEGLESIGDYGFNCCVNLTTVYIPDTVTSMGNGMFVDCVKLESVRLSSNVVQMPSLRRAESLRYLNVPEGVTFIGAYALEGTTLSKLILPKSLKTVDYCATNGCSPMPVCYRGSQEEWAAIDIVANSNDALLNNTNITFNYQGE